VIVLALEPPLLGALELRPGELVVYLGDGTVRIAGRALVAVVRTRPKIHLLGLGKDLNRLELVVARWVVGRSFCVAH